MTSREGRRVCLFAEHHRGGRIPATSLRYLRAIAEAGFEIYAALSGSTEIDPRDQRVFETIGVTARNRRNAGLDFGAWRELIDHGAAEGADQVLLANDSVFGPFAPLAPLMRAMAGFDAWGMVESREGRPHLQSWFVWMTGEAFRRPAVRRVWEQPFEAMSKAEIIVHGELGLSAAFEAEGLDVGARYRDVFRVRPSGLIATNPMHFRWRRLLESGAVPFVKAELLRDNPALILDAGSWARVLEGLGVTWTAEIRAALGDRRSIGAWTFRKAAMQLALREDRLAVLRDVARRTVGKTAGL